MTNALIERIARLMHEMAREYDSRHKLGYCTVPWDRINEHRKEMYRHVARRVLKNLGR